MTVFDVPVFINQGLLDLFQQPGIYFFSLGILIKR